MSHYNAACDLMWTLTMTDQLQRNKIFQEVAQSTKAAGDTKKEFVHFLQQLDRFLGGYYLESDTE